MKIAFISCAAKKGNLSTKAKDLYISSLFKKTLTYCYLQCYDNIYILSAKYGVIGLDDIIDPYNLTLNRMSKNERDEWVKKVIQQLQNIISPMDDLYFYCGKKYYEPLFSLLPNKNKFLPLENLPLGKRLRYLKEGVSNGANSIGEGCKL